MAKSICAVIVAGGQGTRLGASIPKAFVPLADKPLFSYSLQALSEHLAIHSLVLVVPAQSCEETRIFVERTNITKPVFITSGGAERWQSVQKGVEKAPDECQWVLIHDAARPFVSQVVIDSMLEKSTRYNAVITVTPMVDTVRTYTEDCAGQTIDRSQLVRVGTPQLFLKEKLIAAFSEAHHMDPAPTDEAMLMQAIDEKVGIAWGDPLNFKITTPQDLHLAEALCAKG